MAILTANTAYDGSAFDLNAVFSTAFDVFYGDNAKALVDGTIYEDFFGVEFAGGALVDLYLGTGIAVDANNINTVADYEILLRGVASVAAVDLLL